MEVQALVGDLQAHATPSPASQNKVSCPECGASFSRREHLQRHRRSHTNERPFTCAQCGNAFSRMDVLTKHKESHNQQAATPAQGGKSFPRACIECANIRVRCSRGEPCQRCGDKSLRCTYPTARKRKASGLGRDDNAKSVLPNATSRAAETPKGDENSTVPEALIPVTPVSGLQPMNTGDTSAWEAAQTVVPPVEQFVPSNVLDQPNHSMILQPGQMDQSMEWFALNWLSPTAATHADGFTQPGLADGPQLFDYNFPPSVPTVDQWVWSAPTAQPPAPEDSNVTAAYAATAPAVRYSNLAAGSSPSDEVTEAIDESQVSGATPATLYVDGGASRAPFKGLSAQRGANVHDEDSDASQSPTSKQTKGSLSPVASVNLLDQLKTLVSIDQLRGGCFPTQHQLETFFRLHFQYFHPSFPFLRPDSVFYDDAVKWPLLLAVCATGAQYCCKPDSALTRELLIDTLQRTVSEGHALNTGQDYPSSDSDSMQLCMLQARILSLMCQFYTTAQPSPHTTSIDIFKLVQSCRDMRLLRGDLSSKSLSRQSSSPDEVWKSLQSKIRTGYMIWLLDSLLSIENGTETLLSLGDIQCSLPCREFAWERPTMRAIAKDLAHPVDFLDAMEMLYIEKKLPKGLDEFGTIIMVHVIIQRTKAVVKQYQTGLASWVPSASSQKRAPSRRVDETWPPCLPILSRWRNSACDCLDVLHWNANSISARDGGWEPFTIFHLHLSRLILLTPCTPLRSVVARSGRMEQKTSSERSRSQILRWAREDQYKARLAVIHAGALLWHVRRYSINSPVEPFGIYMATLVLWGYSMASTTGDQNIVLQEASNDAAAPARRSASGPSPASAPSNPSVVRSSPPLSGLDEDPEEMQFYVDRPCDDEIVQAYVRYGSKMTGRLSHVGDICHEDAPRKILAEGERILEARQRAGKHHAGSGSSPSGAGGPLAWGITAHYLKILQDFSQLDTA